MIDQPFRARLRILGSSVSYLYRRLGLRPNHVTCLAFLFGALATFFLCLRHELVALCLWWTSRFFDGTDGLYARETSQTSQFGAYLDIVLDMAAYSLMVLGFCYLHPEFALRWVATVVLYVLCITSALALGSFESKEKIGKPDNRGLRLAAGLAEGGETGLAYSAFILFPRYVDPLTIFWIAILVLTVIGRTVLARSELKG